MREGDELCGKGKFLLGFREGISLTKWTVHVTDSLLGKLAQQNRGIGRRLLLRGHFMGLELYDVLHKNCFLVVDGIAAYKLC